MPFGNLGYMTRDYGTISQKEFGHLTLSQPHRFIFKANLKPRCGIGLIHDYLVFLFHHIFSISATPCDHFPAPCTRARSSAVSP